MIPVTPKTDTGVFSSAPPAERSSDRKTAVDSPPEESGNQVQKMVRIGQLPDDMTGLELATRLGANKPALKVIVVGGISRQADQAKPAGLNEMNFLSKPHPPKALAA